MGFPRPFLQCGVNLSVFTHKAITSSLHSHMSCDVGHIVFQVYPVSFISVPTVLLHVPLYLRGLPFPCLVPYGSSFDTVFLPSKLSCPRYLHLPYFITILMSHMPLNRIRINLHLLEIRHLMESKKCQNHMHTPLRKIKMTLLSVSLKIFCWLILTWSRPELLNH